MQGLEGVVVLVVGRGVIKMSCHEIKCFFFTFFHQLVVISLSGCV